MRSPDYTSKLMDEITILANALVLARAISTVNDAGGPAGVLIQLAIDSTSRCADIVEWEQHRLFSLVPLLAQAE